MAETTRYVARDAEKPAAWRPSDGLRVLWRQVNARYTRGLIRACVVALLLWTLSLSTTADPGVGPQHDPSKPAVMYDPGWWAVTEVNYALAFGYELPEPEVDTTN